MVFIGPTLPSRLRDLDLDFSTSTFRPLLLLLTSFTTKMAPVLTGKSTESGKARILGAGTSGNEQKLRSRGLVLDADSNGHCRNR
jgi:hypothetical protein